MLLQTGFENDFPVAIDPAKPILPEEIIRLIATSVNEDRLEDFHKGPRPSYLDLPGPSNEDLLAFISTCRMFYRLSYKHLYTYLAFAGENVDATWLLAETLVARPQYGELVKYIDLKHSEAPLGSFRLLDKILTRCPNLRTYKAGPAHFAISESLWSRINLDTLCLVASYRGLNDAGDQDITVPMKAEMVLAVARAKRACITWVRCFPEEGISEYDFPTISAATKLESLHLCHCYFWERGELVAEQSILQLWGLKLTSLTLEEVYGRGSLPDILGHLCSIHLKSLRIQLNDHRADYGQITFDYAKHAPNLLHFEYVVPSRTLDTIGALPRSLETLSIAYLSKDPIHETDFIERYFLIPTSLLPHLQSIPELYRLTDARYLEKSDIPDNPENAMRAYLAMEAKGLKRMREDRQRTPPYGEIERAVQLSDESAHREKVLKEKWVQYQTALELYRVDPESYKEEWKIKKVNPYANSASSNPPSEKYYTTIVDEEEPVRMNQLFFSSRYHSYKQMPCLF